MRGRVKMSILLGPHKVIVLYVFPPFILQQTPFNLVKECLLVLCD